MNVASRRGSPRHLVIMAAGTGGHVIPGLAVAREMMSRGWTVSWLGTPKGMENRLVPPTGIALDVVGFSGLRGKGGWGMVRGAWQLLRALGQSLAILRRRSATAVLGMGGYVCFPGGLMAQLLRLPLVLVNADAALLLSNRSLLRWADRVALGFDGSAAREVKQGVVTGNPVRAEIEAIAPPRQRYAQRFGPLKVLVVGGSLGAQVLNETLPRAMARLNASERPILTHQTGLAHHATVLAAYREAGLEGEVTVLPFIDNMAERLADCDLIICRAGAITISELCSAGVPAVLVPLVVSTTAHQRDNAQWMASHGAAIHLPQNELSPERLADLLRRLERNELTLMAERARTLAQPHAAQRVADEIEQLVTKEAA
jgi:UDP-N-acetylglucosamine--N-acetylmuramyl-(pentapeptide) pyrophosphoryl-undecaprenol N-acetylglucosamine transferase